jgi:hypothetical protein
MWIVKASFLISTLIIAFMLTGCDRKPTRSSYEIEDPDPIPSPPAGLWQPPADAAPDAGNYVYLQSDGGDFIGGGETSLHTQKNSQITVQAEKYSLSIIVQEKKFNMQWRGKFETIRWVSHINQLKPGYYKDLKICDFSWYGMGRSCNEATAWVAIDKIIFVKDKLTELDLRFEQHNGGAAPALRGRIHWMANVPALPPVPAARPSTLWRPATGNMPATGNYAYLQSERGDKVGEGKTYTCTPATAKLSVSSKDGNFSVQIAGTPNWAGEFQLPSAFNKLQPGYYETWQKDPMKGNVKWSGPNGAGKHQIGWIAIDKVVYADDILTELDFRFEQRCGKKSPALHGQIHWKNDMVPPPLQLPAGLWHPPVDTMPEKGSYVYLQSDPGDSIGDGKTYTCTPANSRIAIKATGGMISLTIQGDNQWNGYFRMIGNHWRLQPGYYGDQQANDFPKGTICWHGQGFVNAQNSWFVIDKVIYDQGELAAIDFRFEQHNKGGTPTLRGQVHWFAKDPTKPASPVNPPPANLWQPPAGTTPDKGNYVYLQSDAGDKIGAGKTYLYTQANAEIMITSPGIVIFVRVKGDRNWVGEFEPIDCLKHQPGYCSDLRIPGSQNTTKARLDWYDHASGFQSIVESGWFVFDKITYDTNGKVNTFDLRFEQRQRGATGALHGKIHWTADVPTMPAMPANPPPSEPWRPAAKLIPATGNYILLQSDPKDRLGWGKTYTYTQQDAKITVAINPYGVLLVNVNGNEKWDGCFQVIGQKKRPPPGHYIVRLDKSSKGNFDWSGQGQATNQRTGWFIIDKATYTANNALSSIDLRFELHGHGNPDALHGQIHWSATDTSQPPGPINPPPELWQAPAGAIPATGNYAYLQSDPGDYIGQGKTYAYTPVNAKINVKAEKNQLGIQIAGDQKWAGDFKIMEHLDRLQPGYYGKLQSSGTYNPTRGFISWFGKTGCCGSPRGWIIIDKATYVDGQLTELDIRFEQRNGESNAALHGKIHWAVPVPPGKKPN